MTDKTKTEMVEMVQGLISRFAFDMVEALAEQAEKDDATMQHLVVRAEQVGAAEATAELFFALIAQQAEGPTCIEAYWRTCPGWGSESKRRAQASSRSIAKFFNTCAEA